jgi:hypothetical protein
MKTTVDFEALLTELGLRPNTHRAAVLAYLTERRFRELVHSIFGEVILQSGRGEASRWCLSLKFEALDAPSRRPSVRAMLGAKHGAAHGLRV